MELNVELVKDEVVVSKYKLSYGLLLFFVKSHFWITNKRLIAHYPNLVAWIIPAGGTTVTYPLQLVRYLISTITAFSKPVLKRICSHQHQSKFN